MDGSAVSKYVQVHDGQAATQTNQEVPTSPRKTIASDVRVLKTICVYIGFFTLVSLLSVLLNDLMPETELELQNNPL